MRLYIKVSVSVCMQKDQMRLYTEVSISVCMQKDQMRLYTEVSTSVCMQKDQVHVKDPGVHIGDLWIMEACLHRPEDCSCFVSETRRFFDSLCTEHNVECSPPRTVARLLDKVSGLVCCLLQGCSVLSVVSFRAVSQSD